MPNTQANTPNNRGTGGGAATSSGIIFQQGVGAFFAATILSNARLDDRLGLGDAVPVWLRFETEAPVDDLLIATSNNGFIAIQAKTTVSISREPNSAFYKTVDQFVRHWLTCRDGDASLGWNRPLDHLIDRLVLAVSPNASASIRVDLPSALRLKTQAGGGTLTQDQQVAFNTFESCIQAAWASSTAEQFSPAILADLCHLVAVLTINLDGADKIAIEARLASSVSPNASIILSLLKEWCGSMMTSRGGGDLSTTRTWLASRGVVLNAAPQYQHDIAALRQHSVIVANALERYESIEAETGSPVNIVRECQASIESAVLSNGSLLIIGEPGAGKSGVINALARTLSNRGDDVILLAVDRYSVESLEGLSHDELQLNHNLVEVINAWDGPNTGWLIIDALDATRGSNGEGVFRTLINRVCQQQGRWKVIASIRSFDLRMGQQFRQLFKGKPPIKQLSDPIFANVCHVHVPRWSDSEFDQLLQLCPPLSSALSNTPARLRDLAKMPFNTRLISELIAQGEANLNDISSQTELLKLYWEHRIQKHGLPAHACLSALVTTMVDTRVLRVSTQINTTYAAMIDELSREGVLIRDERDRWVQFRHHLLFDFAAARVFFVPENIISGNTSFPKQEARGLMLAPALGFVLQEIWEYEADRNQFWQAIGHLVANQDGDPIIRSTAGRIGAEYPSNPEDAIWLGQNATDLLVVATIKHITNALTVRIEDENEINLTPWVQLTIALTSHVATLTETLRLLLLLLIRRVTNSQLRLELGNTARVLLAHGLSLQNPGIIVRAGIDFVAETYETDLAESRNVLQVLLQHERLERFGYVEAPALCHKIKEIGRFDPNFIVEIFKQIYAYEVAADSQTSLGSGQIVSLTSNARQDYGLARYSLSEYFPSFLELYPEQAIDALIEAVNGYVIRHHAIGRYLNRYQLEINGQQINLQEDHSYIWAHDPQSAYDQDADALIFKLLEYLRSTTEHKALVLTNLLLNKASLAVLWSRLFIAASERNDALVDTLWTIAAQEPFIVSPDTRKDAIDLISKGFTRRSEDECIALEQAVFQFDFSNFAHPDEAKTGMLMRLFKSIGQNNLYTDAARAILATESTEGAVHNERLIAANVRPLDTPYPWINREERESPSNVALINILTSTKDAFGSLTVNPAQTPHLSLEDAFFFLDSIRQVLTPTDINLTLRINAEGRIGQGCVYIVNHKLLPSSSCDEESATAITRFLEFFQIALQSQGPIVEDNTEQSFERDASWGSPAARVEATQALFDLFLLQPQLYKQLQPQIEVLLADPHPAVRLQAILHLIRLWDIDRESLWSHLITRLSQETNLGVIAHAMGNLVSTLLHEEPQRVLTIIKNLLSREESNLTRQKRIRSIVANQLTVLWITYSLDTAHEILQQLLDQPSAYTGELRIILSTLRNALVLGLVNQNANDSSIRRRSLVLVSDIVNAANQELKSHYEAVLNQQFTEEAKNCAQTIDWACMQLRFAVDDLKEKTEVNLLNSALEQFLQETEDLLMRIGDYATPHTTYYLVELIEHLIPISPEKSFDLIAHAIIQGARTGFQFEMMGMDLLVKLIGVFLADYKEVFINDARQQKLIDCLEVFMEAGWPSARRLLYRLPELMQ